jgi:uncharacterized protein (DUF39 family)/ferredoxin
MSKSFEEINERIRKGQVVVVTAEEMIGVVEEKGGARAAKEVDVVTTGTFGIMCSSGAFLNVGHTSPRMKIHKAWLNDVAAYAGIAAVDLYIGADEVREHDPLNTNHPGDFNYGGGHVIHDLVAGQKVHLKATAYGTDCYPRRELEKDITIHDLRDATLCNPRNAYQNYNVAVNLSEKTIYTYMGVLKPNMGNINYSCAGQLSPLLNDPYLRTMGIGTRIFLGGGTGYIYWPGTQHNPDPPRTPNGVPREGGGTLGTVGDLKQMRPEWLVGVSMWGYGTSLMVGVGVPIPILDEDMARYTAVRDEEDTRQGDPHRVAFQLCQGPRDRADPERVDPERLFSAGRAHAALAGRRPQGRVKERTAMISRRIVLHFAQDLVDQPIIYRLIKDHNLVFNILKAHVTPQEEGVVVFELTGEERDYEAGIQYLQDKGVGIQPLSEDVQRDEALCTHCGICTVMCPVDALRMDRNTMNVDFDSSKCIVCGACIKSCPPRAMKLEF